MAWALGADVLSDALQDPEFGCEVQERSPVFARVVGLACVCVQAVEGAVSRGFGLERGGQEGVVGWGAWDGAGAICVDVYFEEDLGWVGLGGEGCEKGDLGWVV